MSRVAESRVAVTADGRLVADTDPDAVSLVAGVGGVIPDIYDALSLPDPPAPKPVVEEAPWPPPPAVLPEEPEAEVEEEPEPEAADVAQEAVPAKAKRAPKADAEVTAKATDEAPEPA